MGNHVKRVIAQDSHRNGVGGDSFVVSLFEVAGEKGTFLGISFTPADGLDAISNYSVQRARGEGSQDAIRAVKADAVRRSFITHTAVLNLDETVKGNIAFAEGNSWRGADDYGPELADAWRLHELDDHRYGMSGYDPFDSEAYYDSMDDAERAEAVEANAESDVERLEQRIASLREALALAEVRLAEAALSRRVETDEAPVE